MASKQGTILKNHWIYESRKKESKEEDFEKLVVKNIPSWSSVWLTLLQENQDIRERSSVTKEPKDLQKEIQNRVTELINKEEALVNLYMEAAETAKKKEEEFNCKIAILMQQIERDRNFINNL